MRKKENHLTNIQQVAKIADVSVATVSRVINNSPKVSPKTREKVEGAIASINYVPNMLGRNLRTSASRSILVMVTNISNLFYMETVRGISEVAYENGYDILLSETHEDLKRQTDCLVKVKNRIVDGAIIIESTINDEFLLMLEQTNPVVQCASYSKDSTIPYVSVDNEKGGQLAAKLLIEKGHTRLAFVGTDDKALYNRKRREGFLGGIEEAGLQADPDLFRNVALGFEGGKQIALEFIKLPDPPTAIFFVSDMQAIGAINGLIMAGYTIPQDMAIVGFDNIDMSSMIVPRLTTISQPMRHMGRESARMLIERIRGGNDTVSKNVIFQPEVVLRDTV
ncbi:MAG: LacI family DNA-binding transcriptional regulator [Anaerolineaceae bacterium]|nr:LacI family DNA-binding transcriptional regulator [Anaerolineaceae bacterium]